MSVKEDRAFAIAATQNLAYQREAFGRSIGGVAGEPTAAMPKASLVNITISVLSNGYTIHPMFDFCGGKQLVAKDVDEALKIAREILETRD